MLTVLVSLFWLLALIGFAHTVAAMVCIRHYARQTDPMPTGSPSMTVLKPLHGDEPRLFDNLASVLRQNYAGPVSVVFGVADASDPAAAIVERLRTEFPDAELHLVVDPRRHGRNGKVSNLINMSRAIAGEIVVLADSDMLVEPDYLARVATALQQPGVGAVTCLYRGISLPNLWSRLATGWVDVQFLPNVVLGLTLRLAKPCMGSTIALRRETLKRIGGFEAFKDHLADDYEIGAAVRRLGLRVAVPMRPVLGHTSAAATFGALLRQELRWNRTIKAVNIGGFAGSIVTHPLPFALLAAVADGFRARDGLLVVAVLALRCALAMQVKRFVRKDTADLILLPLRELLSFAVFLGSFAPGSIDWRGHRFGVRSDGIMTARD